MSKALTCLEPKAVWSYFNEITKIPRPSSHEEKIAEFILKFAKVHGFKSHKDEVGNVIIDIEATEDKKDAPLVILQGHMDMVPVVEDGYTHDFLKEGIKAYVDAPFVKAEHTTLGADNGIAIALVMALADDKTLSHGPLRAVFTVEEETTMKGATGLSPEYLHGDYLINLDSEDNSYLFVNCAGSYDVNIKFNFSKVETEDTKALEITMSHLAGGHSGADIHLGHANAIKLLASLLDDMSDDVDFFINNISGGAVRNAIPSKAQCTICVPEKEIDTAKSKLNELFKVQKEIYAKTDPMMTLEITESDKRDALGYAQTLDLIHFIRSLPNGIMRMSPEFSGIVETSINLGVINSDNDCVKICMLARSLNSDALSDMINTVKSQCYLLDNVEVEESNRHEPWSSPSKNRLIDVLNESYKSVTGNEFKVTALHAGVECATFAKANKKLQLISIGPTVLNPHSPKERVDIEGVKDIYLTVSRALAML